MDKSETPYQAYTIRKKSQLNKWNNLKSKTGLKLAKTSDIKRTSRTSYNNQPKLTTSRAMLRGK